jgi:hypothetical protein
MIQGDTSPAEVFEEPYPCETCPYWDLCADETLSCKSFYIYVVCRGQLDLTKRTPSPYWYHKTFIHRGKRELIYERLMLVEQLLESGTAAKAE